MRGRSSQMGDGRWGEGRCVGTPVRRWAVRRLGSASVSKRTSASPARNSNPNLNRNLSADLVYSHMESGKAITIGTVQEGNRERRQTREELDLQAVQNRIEPVVSTHILFFLNPCVSVSIRGAIGLVSHQEGTTDEQG